MSPEEDRTRDTVDSEPKLYQLSYPGPSLSLDYGKKLYSSTEVMIHGKRTQKTNKRKNKQQQNNSNNVILNIARRPYLRSILSLFRLFLEIVSNFYL